MSGSYAQEIVDAYPRLLAENYCILASSALLWFDFTLTLTTEYERIWRRKLTGATIVYLGVRHVGVIERIFFVLEVFVWKTSDRTCAGITHTDDTLVFLSYLAISAFTCLRVYGIWGKDWKPLLIVVPLALVKPFVSLYEAVRYIPVQAGPPFGCVYIYTLSDSVLTKSSNTVDAVPIATEAIVTVLTWAKTFGIVRNARRAGIRSPLATLLLRDGTAYFLFILVAQLSQLLVLRIRDENTFWLVWPYFSQVFINIGASRLILNLRGLYFATGAECDANSSAPRVESNMRFLGLDTANIVGNLGATLILPTHSHRLEYDSPDERCPLEEPLSRSNSTSPPWEGEGPTENDDNEADFPQYSADPFALGMREAIMEDSTVERNESFQLEPSSSAGKDINMAGLERAAALAHH